MTNRNDGGPANCMSIRDAFAMAALQGLIACEAEGFRVSGPDREKIIATECYKQADAMLAEREKRT